MMNDMFLKIRCDHIPSLRDGWAGSIISYRHSVPTEQLVWTILFPTDVAFLRNMFKEQLFLSSR
jgi:hypothetical protein